MHPPTTPTPTEPAGLWLLPWFPHFAGSAGHGHVSEAHLKARRVFCFLFFFTSEGSADGSGSLLIGSKRTLPG